MMEQIRLCAVWLMKLAWLLLQPDAGLDHCPRILLSCFRARTSAMKREDRLISNHTFEEISGSIALHMRNDSHWPIRAFYLIVLTDTCSVVNLSFHRPQLFCLSLRIIYDLNRPNYRVTRQLESYIMLQSIQGVPLSCLGSS